MMNPPKETPQLPIPGYDYGTSSAAISSVSESELLELEQAAGWTPDDAAVLARHHGRMQGDHPSAPGPNADPHDRRTSGRKLQCARKVVDAVD